MYSYCKLFEFEDNSVVTKNYQIEFFETIINAMKATSLYSITQFVSFSCFGSNLIFKNISIENSMIHNFVVTNSLIDIQSFESKNFVIFRNLYVINSNFSSIYIYIIFKIYSFFNLTKVSYLVTIY